MLLPFMDAVVWPRCIALRGAQIGPEFDTEEIATQNATYLVARRSLEINVYEFGMSTRTASEYAELSRLFRLARGKARGFRFEDPLDHSAAGDEVWLQPLTSDTWQMHKLYVDGTEEYARKIVKPMSTPAPVFSSVGVYTIDYETGIVTRSSGASPVMESFSFHVPVWFAMDELRAEIVDRQPGADGELLVSLGRVTLRERTVL